MVDNIGIGNRLKTARIQKGLTQNDIANSIGIATSTIARYEKGQIKQIKLPVVEAISRYLDVNPAWVLGKSKIQHITIAPLETLTNEERQLIKSYNSLDDIDRAEIRGEIKQMLKADKYANNTISVNIPKTKEKHIPFANRHMSPQVAAYGHEVATIEK